MPIAKPELYGTNADGSRSTDYCTYCFQEGRFTEPLISMDQMIVKCTDIMARRKIMPEEQAKGLMQKMIPMLKRWEKP